MENIANKIYIVIAVTAFIGVLYLGIVMYQMLKKERTIDFSSKKGVNYFLGFLVLIPILATLYFLPVAFQSEDFWLENNTQYASIQNAIMVLGSVILGFYILVRATIFFPHRNEYYNIVPQLLLLSLFPGVSNAIIVMIISKFITDDVEAKYLLLFFAVATFIYIVTIRISKRKTTNIGVLIAHKFNLLVVDKIFKIPFRKYEKVKSGKVYTILNDDINEIFFLSQSIIQIYTSLITTLIVLVYLVTLNITSSLMLLAVTGLIMGIVVLMSKPLKRVGNKSRLKRESFTNLISGLLNGFKELVLHKVKRDGFQMDIEQSSRDSFKARQSHINLTIDSALFSELSFTIAVGVSCLLFPLLFDFDKELITAYVIAVLFLLGPVGTLINEFPKVINAQMSWKRIKDFLSKADTEIISDEYEEEGLVLSKIKQIKVDKVCFTYQDETKQQNIKYGIGPIDFVANQGELVFIVGGNGSGKTTFLKLLIGLYKPSSGQIQINGETVSPKVLSEYFSVIYSDFYLFKKLYDIQEHRLGQVHEWLKVLQLSDKVKIENGAFSTIDLSKGQRKRLAILKSYLEDRPVYFFDEVAADLDPGFRDFFYNKLLIKMREEGKILIIISHDDKYFDLADNIYKMDMGRISIVKKEQVVLAEQY